MFEIGFSELVMVALVSLLVIGPERLPKAARLAGYWLGKTRAMIGSVKAEIQLELRAEEMRQLFKDESGLNEFQSVIDEANESVNSIQSSITSLSKDSVDLTKRLPHEFE
ncbi:MAG: Sec-independent protein translocase protein TatB [Methylococcales bacterium]|jgi:sec-independent protein translocase protein TatB|nr:Sec-independent protein translocase protein TatB [Methylococcales bacterium]